MLSSFTHLHVVPNPYEFLSSAEHKERYFEKCGWLNSCCPYWVPYGKNTLKVNGDQSDGLPTFLKIYFVCVCLAEREYIDLEQLE